MLITNAPSEDEITRISEFCRANKIHFIAADTYGLFAYVFDDFGLDFEIHDRTGEPEKKSFIELVTKAYSLSLARSLALFEFRSLISC